jgi:hypothetical protein
VTAAACRLICCQFRQLQQPWPLLQPLQQSSKRCHGMRSQNVLQEAMHIFGALLLQQLFLSYMCRCFQCCCICYAVLEQARLF